MSDQSEDIKKQVDSALDGGLGAKLARFSLTLLAGAVSGLENVSGVNAGTGGGVISGMVSAWSEKEQADLNRLLSTWLKLQEDEIKEIARTLVEVMIRLDQTDEKIRERIESPEYLKLLKKAVRNWSAAESEEKRILIRNLLANAAATKICTDDVVALFIQWIDVYSEAHFRVIREIYNKSGITRKDIWLGIHGEIVREDSADADLFKLLIQDLTMGHVIRQHREVDYYGNFVPKTPQRSPKGSGRQYESAFDEEEEYELTELGKQFVHYTMNEIVPKLGNSQQTSS